MKRVKFLMVGGFLGAGKTTTIARLARHYTDNGHRVGLVTNDQAYDLVDTHSLRAQGFQVGEVPGACFCCKFDDLVDTAKQLNSENAPDLIIAEPVGSCTDLVATVIEPLRHLYADDYEIGPLAVLLKPEHGQKILRSQQNAGFSPKAEYIFLKQIEEADVVVINKIDKLSADEVQELVRLVSERYPGKQVIAISAREGERFDELLAALEQEPVRRTQFMDVDYQVYAEGEAELGWLNCQAEVTASEPFVLDNLLVDLVDRLSDALDQHDAEAAHLKVLGQSGTDAGIANLVGGGSDVELSLASEVTTASADLIVNARVATAPEELEAVVVRVLAALCLEWGLDHTLRGMQRFRPAPPQPTHRYSSE